MIELKKEEMYLVEGGAITSSFINAITKTATFIYNLGQSVGSSIRRLWGGKYCPTS